MPKTFWLLAAVALCALMQSPMAQSPTAQNQDQPILMLGTGGHQAVIKGLTFTPDGKYLVSAGDDKVIRVWDWQAGKTVRTIRGQVGPGDEGKIYAMALSHDGRWLAVGGYVGTFTGTRALEDEYAHQIRLYDFASGTLKALLKGHLAVVNGLAFSPDSKFLISGSGLGDFSAIIWDVATAAKRHQLAGHRAHIYGVTFTTDGARAVTASFDNTLRLWNAADGSLIKEMRGHSDKVRSVAVSPKDGTIASGDASGEIRLWDSTTGEPRGVFAKQGGYVGSLRFSPDGNLLLATCGYTGCDDKQRIFDVASGNALTVYAKHDSIVLASAFSPDGRLVATGGGANQEIHIWDPRTGETKAILKGTGQPVWTAAFSSDGRQIAWGQTARPTEINNRGPLEMALRLPDAGDAIGEPSRVSSAQTYVRAQASLGAFTLRHRAGGAFGYDAILEILRDGKVQARIERGSTDGFQHRAYTFTPDGQTIISGGDSGYLAAYGLDGKEIGEFIGHEGVVWAVAVSSDGKYLVSGAHDQTVRLWDVKTRALLVTLFYGTDGEWVMWTPEGFFTRSQNGGDHVGWQINRGVDKAADYVTGEQVRDAFFRPDLVAEKIAGDPDGKVKKAAEGLKIEDVLKSGLAPEVTIISATVEDVSVTVRAGVLDKGGGIGRIAWKVNGQEIQFDYGAAALKQGEITRKFELASTDNKIEVLADNKSGLVTSKPASVSAKADKRALDSKGLPDLYILAIGVDEYNDVKRNLKFAVSDAKVLSETIADAGKSYYRNPPQVVMLPNDQVTADRLAETFKQLGTRIKANDVFLFFVAGHGKMVNGDYYFVPGNVASFTEGDISKQGFGPKQWRDWFANIKAQKSVFIFDTCDAGAAVRIFRAGDNQEEVAQQRIRAATGRTMFLASSDQQTATEGFHGHGILTYAILEGLALAGDERNKMVSLTDLKDYVEIKVPQYSREMKACVVTKQQEYCQKPQVPFTADNYALVPRYPAIMARLRAGDVVISKIPTHVVIAAAELRQTVRGEGTTTQLPQGTLVTLIKTEGEWAYVAKDGKPLGYILNIQLSDIK